MVVYVGLTVLEGQSTSPTREVVVGVQDAVTVVNASLMLTLTLALVTVTVTVPVAVAVSRDTCVSVAVSV